LQVRTRRWHVDVPVHVLHRPDHRRRHGADPEERHLGAGPGAAARAASHGGPLMDFGLSAEQRLLDESLQRYLEANLPMRRVREILRSEEASKRELWQSLVELGVPGLLV